MTTATATGFSITVTDENPLEHEERYECAAWWTKMRSVPGEYELKVVKEYHHTFLMGKIKAVVVEDYFPALWCGVSVSKKPYDTTKNAGNACEFTLRLPVDAFVKDARLRANRPEIIDDYCNAALEVLKKDLEHYADWLRRELGTEGMPKDGILDYEFVTPAKFAVQTSERIHAVQTFRKWHENTWKYQERAKDYPDNYIHKVTYWKQ
jgi:hypothetical protein